MAVEKDSQESRPRISYTRRIIRESIATDLNTLIGKDKLQKIPETSGFLLSDFSDNSKITRDTLPLRIKQITGSAPPPGKVCIIGAGMAGLYTALILDQLSIPYDILEASGRPGGRVLTHYFSTKKHDYFDVGAMRFPNSPPMARVFDLFKRAGVELGNYQWSGPGCISYFNTVVASASSSKASEQELDVHMICETNGGSVPASMMPRYKSILNEAFKPFREAIMNDDPKAYQMIVEADNMTCKSYLHNVMGIDYHTIEWLEQITCWTGLFEYSFSEAFMDALHFEWYTDNNDWKYIKGGASALTQRLCEMLKFKPQYSQQVTRVALDRKWTTDENKMVVVCNYDDEPRRYTSVINTATLPCLQRIDTTNLELPTITRDAIRVLKYTGSVKIGIKFDHPWWATECGITNGGISNTDLPIRVCVYPSYNVDDPKDDSAVLLASYTWQQDAERIGSLVHPDSPNSEEDLKRLVLYNLARIHSTDATSFERIYKIIQNSYVTHYSYNWTNDRFANGGATMFGPGQFRYYYPHLIRPCADSRFHIAGEAASGNHSWILGSLESAYRAVWLYLERFNCYELQARMEANFGTLDELDTGDEGFAHLLVALGMTPRRSRDQVFTMTNGVVNGAA